MILDVKSGYKSNGDTVMYYIGLRKQASDWKDFTAHKWFCSLQGCTKRGKNIHEKTNQKKIPLLWYKWTELLHELKYYKDTCSTFKSRTFIVSGIYVTRTERQWISIEVSWALLTVWPFVPREDSCQTELIWLQSLTIYLGQSYLICGFQVETGSSEK